MGAGSTELPLSARNRVVEDYGVIYLGSAVFKIARLLFIALFSVHFFACLFFKVKIVSANTPDDVTAFYTSRNVAQDVSIVSIVSKAVSILLSQVVVKLNLT